MKKLILYLLIGLCFLSGCSYSNTASSNNLKKQSSSSNSSSLVSNMSNFSSAFSEYSSSKDEPIMHVGGVFDANETKSVQSIFNKLNLSTDYHKLINHTISVNNFFHDFFFQQFNKLANYNPVIDMINEKYPIQCIRKIGNHSYSIFQGDDGSLIYVFYMDNGFMAQSIYMKRKLSSSDFNQIAKGSNLSTVEKIDPAATIWTSRYVSTKANEIFSFHLLTDGILKFTYTRQSDGSYSVSNKYYNKGFKYKPDPETYLTDFDFTILPQDYIH